MKRIMAWSFLIVVWSACLLVAAAPHINKSSDPGVQLMASMASGFLAGLLGMMAWVFTESWRKN